MVQANSISSMVNEAFRIVLWITGIAMAVLTAVVILDGIKSIANVCEKLVQIV
jgi:alanine or glycine:cation symporter, AGCS family